MIPYSLSAQDLRSLDLMPSGPVAFLALIFLSFFLTRVVVTDRLEQGDQGVFDGEGDGCVIGEEVVGLCFWEIMKEVGVRAVH